MSCDKLVFDLAQEAEGSANVFIKKDWISILDNQNGNYNSNSSVLDTSQLSNSNKYMSYREAYLAVPMLLSVACTTNTVNFVPATAATSADYAVGLKSWFGQIIHSFTLDYNGTTIIQQTPFCNMWNSFKLMTTLSWNDVITDGCTMGFYPDDPLAWSFFTAANPNGIGVCNNTNFSDLTYSSPVTGSFTSYKSTEGNEGFIKRQQYINYDPAGIPGTGAGASTYGALLSGAQSAQLWKSYISNKIDGTVAIKGCIQFSIMGFIHLRHIHSFFNQVPLLKGVFMKMTMFLNNTTVGFTSAAGVFSIDSVSNAVGGVCPIMVASKKANNGGVAFGDASYLANLSVGNTCLDSSTRALLTGTTTGQLSNSIYLYVPAYTFNPVFEQAYLSAPVKTVKYTDIYQYQVLNVSANNGQVNSLLTNGLSNIKSVLVLPFHSASNNPTNRPVYQSPFDPAGTGCTSPLSLLTNFNVVVSGQNAIYNTERYSFEQFINQTYGVNAVNGGMVDGLTSGLIDQLGFEMEYCYYYVDVSRMLPVEESVPKSVQIIGQNSCGRQLDLWCFIEYGVSISFDILTGARV
jgi:hypothetical protein